jgi:hypothetical protein
MKAIKYLFVIVFAAVGCKKETTGAKAIGSITIINALSDNSIIEPNFTDSLISFSFNLAKISLGNSIEFGEPTGVIPLSVVSSADTMSPIFQQNIEFESGSIRSLFLANLGEPKECDYVLTLDTIPSISDSSAGVRFINLSPGGRLISVNLAGNPGSQTEFNNLAYEKISNFRNYPATALVGGVYSFEIRNESNDSLLATYQWSFTLQKSNTIVISGIENHGLNVFQVNNF